jgi:hypothetical protein
MTKQLSVLALALLLTLSAQAKTPVKGTSTPPKKTYYETHTRYSSDASPWDFSAMLGLYNPGTGFGALAAYRIVDDLLPNATDSLSIESGLNYVNISDTIASTSVSYSVIEIPIQARWDFKILDNKLIVGPRAGLNYLTAQSVSIGGTSYSVSRSGGLYFQLGGFAIYKFNENWGARAGLAIGSYTTLSLGVNFAL